MDTKIGSLIDTQMRNHYWESYSKDVIVKALMEPIVAVTKAREQKASIDADHGLTPLGKTDARKAARAALREAVTKWHGPKRIELEADIASQRMALMPKGPEPDARKVDFMLGLMQKNSPEENATFYEKASDAQRLLMEAASAAVGDTMQKTGKSLQWQPMLHPETVQESVIARATATNPGAVKKLKEIESILDIHKTVAAHAVAEINEVLGDP